MSTKHMANANGVSACLAALALLASACSAPVENIRSVENLELDSTELPVVVADSPQPVAPRAALFATATCEENVRKMKLSLADLLGATPALLALTSVGGPTTTALFAVSAAVTKIFDRHRCGNSQFTFEEIIAEVEVLIDDKIEDAMRARIVALTADMIQLYGDHAQDITNFESLTPEQKASLFESLTEIASMAETLSSEFIVSQDFKAAAVIEPVYTMMFTATLTELYLRRLNGESFSGLTTEKKTLRRRAIEAFDIFSEISVRTEVHSDAVSFASRRQLGLP